jgi:hypothetical protein
MNKQELAILERAFDAEVTSALQGGPHVMQSRSKVARKLCDEGFLEEGAWKSGPVIVRGYVLTHAGRMAYCMTCEGPEATNEHHA